MNQKSVVLFSALVGLTLVMSGCPGNGESDLGLAIDTSKAALGTEYDADLTTFDSLGFTADKQAVTVPDISTDSVQFYGEAAAVTFGRDKLKGTTKTQGDYLRTIVQNGAVDGAVDFGRGLVAEGRTDQTDPVLNQPLIRYSFIELGYRIGNIVCLNNIHKQTDSGEPLYRTRCDLMMDLGTIWESYALQQLLYANITGELRQEGAALNAYLTAIDNVVKLATPVGAPAPSYIQDLSLKAEAMRAVVKTRQTQQTSFGEKVQAGLNQAGSALASGAALIVPVTDPAIQNHSTPATGLLDLIDRAMTAQADVDAGESGSMGVGSLPQDTLGALNDSAMAATSAIGAASGGDSQSALMQATQSMHETQMSFNLQYLQLQNQMQNENRQYTAVSNILKTKHDTVKNSIGNIR